MEGDPAVADDEDCCLENTIGSAWPEGENDTQTVSSISLYHPVYGEAVVAGKEDRTPRASDDSSRVFAIRDRCPHVHSSGASTE